MKSILFFVFVCLSIVFAESSLSSVMDGMLFLLQKTSISQSCSEKVKSMIIHFIQDSTLVSSLLNSGKGLNDLGNYEGCNKNPNTAYYVIQLLNLPISVTIGICSPKECSVDDYDPVKDFLADAINSALKINGTSPIKNITRDDVLFINPKEKRLKENFFSVQFWYTTGIFLFFIGAAVIVGIWRVCYPKFFIGNSKEFPIIKCFDPIENYGRLLGNSPEETNPDLRVMNGIRLFSQLWVIYAHAFYYDRYGPITNPHTLEHFIKGFWNSYVVNASFSVDIFFFISGFLAFYQAILAQTDGNKGGMFYWRVYIHRLLRMAPLYYCFILIFAWLLPFVIEGPISYLYTDKLNNGCRTVTYASFLFANNMIDQLKECAPWMWYITNVMQFFIIVPIIAYFYNKSRKIGGLLLAGLAFGNFIVLFIVCWHFNLSASIFKFTEDYFQYFYEKQYARIHTYLLGILAGMIYVAYKEKQQNWMYKLCVFLREYNWIRRFIYLVSLFAMFWIIHAMYWLNNYADDWTKLEDISYLTLSKPLFIVCFFFLVFPSFIGRGYLIRNALGHRIFAPFGKMTYAAYMCHPMLMLYYVYNSDTGIVFEYRSYILKFMGYALFAYFTSFVLTPLIGTPLVKLSEAYIKDWNYPVYPQSFTGEGEKQVSAPEIANDSEETAKLNDGTTN